MSCVRCDRVFLYLLRVCADLDLGKKQRKKTRFIHLYLILSFRFLRNYAYISLSLLPFSCIGFSVS